jgi:hypothetical protein
MTKSKGNTGNTKAVVVKTEDGKTYKTFKSSQECADYFNLTRQAVYGRTNNPKHFYKHDGTKLSFNCISNVKKVKDQGETEDEIRRRLELNPYGEWRKKENLLALIERCNKMMFENGTLDPDPEYRAMRDKARRQNERWIKTQNSKEGGDWFNVNVDTRNMEL